MSLSMIALALAAAPPATPAMNAADPTAFHESLRDMGYAPEAMDMSSDAPSTIVTAGDGRFWVVMGGCEQRRACSYIVVGSSFNDVLNPPAAWVAEQNRDFDLIKVWMNDDKQLSYASSVLTRDLTRAQFRSFMDALIESEGSLGKRAIDAKLTRK